MSRSSVGTDGSVAWRGLIALRAGRIHRTSDNFARRTMLDRSTLFSRESRVCLSIVNDAIVIAPSTVESI